jgi:3-hydroxyisobutyrate dehydrogenase
VAGCDENAPAPRGYSGGFGASLMLKDLGLSQQAAASAQTATPLGSLAPSCISHTSRTGNGADDSPASCACITAHERF